MGACCLISLVEYSADAPFERWLLSSQTSPHVYMIFLDLLHRQDVIVGLS